MIFRKNAATFFFIALAFTTPPCLADSYNVTDEATLSSALTEVSVTPKILNINSYIAAKANLASLNAGDNITIYGGNYAIDGRGLYKGLNVLTSSVVNIKNLTLSNFSAMTSGGAIENNGVGLAISNSTFTSNKANQNAGAIENTGSGATATISGSTFTGNTAVANGGAIENNGATLAISDSAFTSNKANQNAGAIENTGSGAKATISGSTFTGNTAVTNGGAIENNGATLAISNSIFTNNKANQNAGAIENTGSGATATISGSTFTGNTAVTNGGAIENNGATLAISNSTFTNNKANQNAGAIENTGIGAKATISGSTFTGNTAVTNGGAIENNGATLAISNSTFTNNKANQNAGAIENTGIGAKATISGSTFTGNTAVANGGAIENNGGALTVSDTTFTTNSAVQNGGVLYNTGFSSQAMATISDSTFTKNTAAGNGGAIYNVGQANGATVTISDSTFTNNSAREGGAIYNGHSNATLTISNSKFTGNSAANNGGAIYNNAGTVNITGDAAVAEFTGNTAKGASNDIYNDSVVNLYARNGGSIIFNGGIDGSTGIINIDANNNSKGGSVVLNCLVKNHTVNLDGGMLTLGKYKTAVTNYFDNTSLALNAGLLNTANGNIDTIALSSLNSTNAGLFFDATINADSTSSDSFTSGNTSGGLLIKGINILSDTQTTATAFDLGLSGLTLSAADFTAYTNGYKYKFGAASVDGKLTYTQEAGGGLEAAVASGSKATSFSATGNYSTSSDLALLNNNTGQLTIFGNNFDINGNGHAGLTFFAWKTVHIYKVGNTSDDNSLGFNNFQAVEDGGVICNDTGNLFISDSKFTNNAAVGYMGGGAIYNAGVLTVRDSTFTGNSSLEIGGAISSMGSSATATISDSTFKNNKAFDRGGAFFVFESTATISDSTFIGNCANNEGGAIASNSSTSTISGSTFTRNTAVANGGAIENNGGVLTVSDSAFTSNSANQNGGAIYNQGVGTKATISGSTFTVNSAEEGGGAIYNANVLKISDSTFTNNSSVKNGGAIYNAGISAIAEATISGSTFTGNSTAANGGVLFNVAGSKNATVTISDSAFTGNSAKKKGGAIYNTGNGSKVTVSDSTFTGNSAATGGGAIYNKTGILNIIADARNTTFTNNSGQGKSNDIYLDVNSTLNLNASTGRSVAFNSGVQSVAIANTININKSGLTYTKDGSTKIDSPTGGEVVFNAMVENSTLNLYNGKLTLGADNYLDGNVLTLAGGTLKMQNGSVGTMALSSLAVAGDTQLAIDVDLANSKSDMIKGAYAASSSKLNINSINILSDSKSSTTTTQLLGSNLVGNNIVSLGVAKAYTPIYQYNIDYDDTTGAMTFTGGGGSTSSGYNPAILSSPVSANVGAYMSQLGTYTQALGRAEIFMSLPSSARNEIKYRNKYAAAGEVEVSNLVFSPTFLPEEEGGLWFKQETSFENVPLNNGPNVSNVGYTSMFGGDTPLKYIGHGFDGYLTLYAGYNGSHQNYGQVGVNQNGGSLGVTGTVYRGNLFAAITATVGDSAGEANTIYGTDNFNTVLAGTAVKAGYNFEFLRGKMILQPSLLASYTFAKTFDYGTSSGVSITSDPLNVIQVSPGVKLIGNLEKGWQPYLATNMVWNIMDIQKFYANDAQLPQMSIAPYVEYGVGVQRRWAQRFTGFGQAMLRGGGRNGLALQFGFRYALGK